MKQTFILLLMAFFYPLNTINAQTPDSNATLVKNVKQPKAKEGTYQFIYHPSKFKYLFAAEALVEIEKNRDEKAVKYIWLNPFVEVKILPKSYIESPNFIPLPEKLFVD